MFLLKGPLLPWGLCSIFSQSSVSSLIALIWVCNDVFMCEIIMIKFCLQYKMVNSRRVSSSFLLAWNPQLQAESLMHRRGSAEMHWGTVQLTACANVTQQSCSYDPRYTLLFITRIRQRLECCPKTLQRRKLTVPSLITQLHILFKKYVNSSHQFPLNLYQRAAALGLYRAEWLWVLFWTHSGDLISSDRFKTNTFYK